ncbi:MAG: prepilin-type N-terminal cleavage/methylation domain-containing protein [Thermoleophilia bacterium]|nr:prepilin-type N-terminal cleavage/methylation domain-containing protein [Thermoleophilia bacterium]
MGGWLARWWYRQLCLPLKHDRIRADERGVLHTPNPQSHPEAGYSLVELMIVVVVIAIVMSAAVMVFHSARSSAGASSATSVAKAYREAVEQFSTDHQGRLPRAIGTPEWPVAVQGPITEPGLARKNGRYLRSIPEAVSDGSIGVGSGGNFGHIEYRVSGATYEIDVIRKDGVRVCSTGNVHRFIVQPCETNS